MVKVPPLGGQAPPDFCLAAIFFGPFGLSPDVLFNDNGVMTGCPHLPCKPCKGCVQPLALVATVLLTSAMGAAAASSRLHVMIDPGHGGVDSGASRGGLKESEIVLTVAKRLVKLLEDDPRFQASLTRSTDHFLTLLERAQLARAAKADLFLSIHVNSSRDRRAWGKEFYFQNQLPVDEEAMFIASRENAENRAARAEPLVPATESFSAENDVRRILEDLRRNERILASSELSKALYETWIKSGHKAGSRAIRQAPFYVVSNVDVPSVLVELGFLSHPVEGPRLATKTYQAELAQSIYESLIAYKERMDNDVPRPLH